MWMMGCSDGTSGALHKSDSFNGRKLRPLIPRPTHLSTTSTATSSSSSSCFSRVHSSTADLFALHNHLGVTEQGMREAGSHPASSRWNPTPEQLRTLEDLYGRGTRTPTTDQIQHITAQLRRYGKIEGKNVFYWFQNHKARERQKRRRQIEAAMAMEREVVCFEKKEHSAMSRTEECKNLSPTNCSILAGESAPVSNKAERAREGWLQCDRKPHHQSSPEGIATWHLMHLSSLPQPINTTATTITTTAPYEAPAPADPQIQINGSLATANKRGQSRTLELFPLHSSGTYVKMSSTTTPPPEETSAMANLAPYQFFQFL